MQILKERKTQNNSKIDQVRTLYNAGLSVLEIAHALHQSPQNIYGYIQRYNLKRPAVDKK